MSGILRYKKILLLCRPTYNQSTNFKRCYSKFPKKNNSSLGFKGVSKYSLIGATTTLLGLGLYQLIHNQASTNPTANSSKTRFRSENLRQNFNFIDKVVKKCASSVVYIEIKDANKIDPQTNKPTTSSNGSGFLIRDDGWILTNAHVVINKPNSLVMIMLQDGSVYQASVEDADMNIDLALLKIEADRKLPFLELGNSSEVTTGEWVIALGSPLSLSHSVTAGVISSVNRAAQELGLQNYSMRYIQTDAAITFGNSGGPLVNLDGDVIGINNLRVTAGISFAIPVDYAKQFLDKSRLAIKEYSNLNNNKKSFLGITTISVTSKIIGELREIHQSVPDELLQGVLVWKVVDGAIGELSGLVAGDIITHIDGMPVRDASDIYVLCTQDKKNIKMNVIHLGKKKTITVKTDY